MALAIYFPVENMTKANYDKIFEKLEAAGASSPKGRSFHCGFGSDDSVQVFDIWESQDDFDAFAPTLMPILDEVGVTMPEPVTAEVQQILP
jgi:hypothetical protein